MRRQESAGNRRVDKMASMNKGTEAKRQGGNRKQLLEELNEKRESYCLVERSNQVSLLRVQKRHFSQAYQSLASRHVKESVPESTRTSWIQQDLYVHKEKRHFLPKSASSPMTTRPATENSLNREQTLSAGWSVGVPFISALSKQRQGHAWPAN
ncbi:Spermatogenesis-associated protein 45 [Apodemus speciosus]|uniref:Spermatogenesis-associated protein 45 n=1 Tax=Apodemus speciosus TaxID=105296 RepID=A0ABQ0EFG3_APOSI